MKILALDFSAANRRTAAVAEIVEGNVKILGEASEEVQRGGSPFPLIERALGDLKAGEVEGLVVALGPGSYVGIRSALAVAQGWHIAHGTLACGFGSSEGGASALAQLAAKFETKFVSPDQLEAIYTREISYVKAPPPRVVD